MRENKEREAPTKIFPPKKYDSKVVDKCFVLTLRIQDLRQKAYDCAQQAMKLRQEMYSCHRQIDQFNNEIAKTTGVGKVIDYGKKKKFEEAVVHG